MKVLITSARAPITIEWVKLFAKQDCQVFLIDSLRFPLAAGLTRKYSTIFYQKVASPRFNFVTYQKQILTLIDQVDWVIPTCEDIFYLAQIEMTSEQRKKCWMPSPDILLRLHHKYQVKEFVESCEGVKFPKTILIASKEAIDWSFAKQSILKPVYSRFGESVIMKLSEKTVFDLEISDSCPWIQQEKLQGHAYCSYALCNRGEIVDQVVYKPRYTLEGSASTYFKAEKHLPIQRFMDEFAKKYHYHGQLAFDFIETKEGLYIIECNPRSTSGLHLLAERWYLKNQTLIADTSLTPKSHSIGVLMLILFGWKAVQQRQVRQLIRDYKVSQSIFKELSIKDLFYAVLEFRQIARKRGLSITGASTYDIEYNGEMEYDFG